MSDARQVAQLQVGDTIRYYDGSLDRVAEIRVVKHHPGRDLLDVIYECGARSRYWSTDTLYREGVIV